MVFNCKLSRTEVACNGIKQWL